MPPSSADSQTAPLQAWSDRAIFHERGKLKKRLRRNLNGHTLPVVLRFDFSIAASRSKLGVQSSGED
jgi:hypothetical protein